MTARSDAKGTKAKNDVQDYLQQKSVANDEIYVLNLDLNDFASVRAFPDQYKRALGSRKIDVLMNNAGAKYDDRRELTGDGLERTFQSNHVGPFLLTSLLFPYLDRNGARVINVSSMAHNLATVVKTGKQGLDMDNLNGELSYGTLDGGWDAYGNTKLENIFFTEELQRRADASGLTWLSVVSLHPGVVGTDIWRNSFVGGVGANTVSLKALTSRLFFSNVLTTEEGANTQVKLAASKDVSKGSYYDEFGKLKALAPFARDETKARELWEVSEKLSGSAFKVE
ncbi:hypothetical protein ACHAXT_011518 [Thalassiosira profunda]